MSEGPFKCYVTLFSWKLDPHPPPRNANNIEPYTFVTLLTRKINPPSPPALRNTWMAPDLEQTHTIFYLEWLFFAITFVRSVQSRLDSTHIIFHIESLKSGYIEFASSTPPLQLCWARRLPWQLPANAMRHADNSPTTGLPPAVADSEPQLPWQPPGST